MKDITDFIKEIYGLDSDAVVTQHAVDSFVFDENDNRLFFILSTSEGELKAVQAVISYLHNNNLINQNLISTISGSDYATFENKFSSLFITEKYTDLKKLSLTKSRLESVLEKLLSIINETQYLAELFKSKEDYIVSNIEEKIVRQLDKAIEFFETREQVKVSEYDSVSVNMDSVELLRTNIHTLIEKLNTDISRQSLNINVENSLYLNSNKEIEILITDKVFIGDPIFLFGKLASLLHELESNIDIDELWNLVKDTYEDFVSNHFSTEYFEFVTDAYLFISLYQETKHAGDLDLVPTTMEIAKGLYGSKMVEWV